MPQKKPTTVFVRCRGKRVKLWLRGQKPGSVPHLPAVHLNKSLNVIVLEFPNLESGYGCSGTYVLELCENGMSNPHKALGMRKVN